MGHRISKVTTHTGDDGTTGLGNGSRVTKDHVRIEVIGDVDELNSCIGMVLSHPLPDEIRRMLTNIQHTLFETGSEICQPDKCFIASEHAEALERFIENLNASLPPLNEFILPGGSPAAASCHLARAVCRRAERSLVALEHEESVNPHTLAYFNRLSDLLFVTARTLTRFASGDETQWIQRK